MRLEIFDSRGRLVRPLIDEYRTAGSHAIEWDRRDGTGLEVPSGIYFVRLVASRSRVENATSQRVIVIQ